MHYRYLGLFLFVNAICANIATAKQPVLLDDNLTDTIMLGKSFFSVPWVLSPSSTTARDGLGPLHNANSCISCHPKLKSANFLNKKNQIAKSNIIKISKDKTYGIQIATQGSINVPYEARIKISYEEVDFYFPDGERVILQKPTIILQDLQYGNLEQNTNLSLRRSPSVLGLGTIEDINQEDILANEDILDEDKDGISGKANRIFSPINKQYEIGKFTAKASSSSLLHQTTRAAREDMGLTSVFLPKENCTLHQIACNQFATKKGFDISQKRLEAITTYLQTRKKPYQQTSHLSVGKKLFSTLGCAKCHIENISKANTKKASIYSDFLLHDMGKGLSDEVSEFDAKGNEWRTAPLWGIGARQKEAKYLHDGRARTLQEAILWHKGEATQAMQNYAHLPKKQRQEIINFLKRL